MILLCLPFLGCHRHWPCQSIAFGRKKCTQFDGSSVRNRYESLKDFFRKRPTGLTLRQATRAREVSQAVKKVGFSGVVAGTRKTTPGFRLVEKYALIVGGCDQHRYDLSRFVPVHLLPWLNFITQFSISMIMLKDNHIWSSGSITEAVRRAKSVGGFALKVEVECQSQAEAEEAINAGADIVMLDNFNPIILKQTAQALKSKHAHVIVEASGGITAETVAEYCCPHVDVISMGSLTQGVPHIDFSLKIVPARSK